MDLGLNGKTALITGADSGIGLACARELLAEGATVIIADMFSDRLEEAAAQLACDRLHHAVVDVSSEVSVLSLARQVAEEIGPVHIVINAAGIHGPQGRFDEIDADGWLQTLSTNLLGGVRVTRAFLPGMRAAGWGRVIFISSEDGMQPYDNELPYAVSKGGINTLAKGLSRTYAREGVLVNTVSPAFIATPMTDEMMTSRAESKGTSVDEAIAGFLAEERPSMETDRRGRPEEVAAVVAFLCSERASFVNGANYRVDAGSVWTI